MNSTIDGSLPTLTTLAQKVVNAEIGIVRAAELVARSEQPELLKWIREGYDAMGALMSAAKSDILFCEAFLELGMTGAIKAEIPLYRLVFGVNLAHLMCTYLDNVETGFDLLHKCLADLRVLNLDSKEQIQLLLTVADLHLSHHNKRGSKYLDVAAQAYRDVIELVKSGNSDAQTAGRAHAGLGRCLVEFRHYGRFAVTREAIEHLEYARGRLDPAADQDLCADVLVALGLAYRHCRDGDHATNIREAVECFQSLVSVSQVGGGRFRMACVCLADTHADVGQWMTAVELYERAIETVHPIQERSLYAELFYRLGGICIRANPSTALTRDYMRSLGIACYVVSRESADQSNDIDTWAAATAGLAAARERQGKFDNAFALREEAIGKLDSVEHARRRSRIAADHLQGLASLIRRLVKKNNLSDARNHFKTMRQLADYTQSSSHLESHHKSVLAAMVARAQSVLASTADEHRRFCIQERQYFADALEKCAQSTPHHEVDALENELIRLTTEIDSPGEAARLVRHRRSVRHIHGLD